jgi:L-ascorbate metabolism protein UlaG (beta-lactamase superfamily)
MKPGKILVAGSLVLLELVCFAFGSAGEGRPASPVVALTTEQLPKGSGDAYKAPAAGGAVIWYLGHCGYAVRTRNHFLVFDYQEKQDGRQSRSRPAQPSLANGWIEPGEIKNLRVRVFVSHSHDDHYDPIIFTWKDTVANIAYFFGWKAANDPSYQYLVGPRAELKSAGLEIATINSHHSGVPEVAWLIKVDGLVVYHNGDCQPVGFVNISGRSSGITEPTQNLFRVFRVFRGFR